MSSSNIFRVLKTFVVKLTLLNDIQIKEDATGNRSSGHRTDKNWGQNKSAGNPEQKRVFGRLA
jgi:hypothetical protein